jgi:hypothetical protein
LHAYVSSGPLALQEIHRGIIVHSFVPIHFYYTICDPCHNEQDKDELNCHLFRFNISSRTHFEPTIIPVE